METSPEKERVRAQGRKIENKEGERERREEGGEVGVGGTRRENRNKNRSERTARARARSRDVHGGELRGTRGGREIKEERGVT